MSGITLDAKVPAGPITEKWDRHKFEMKLVNPANKRKYSIICVGTGLAGASAAASLGADHPRWTPKILAVGKTAAVVIAGGFIVIALWAHSVGAHR